MRAGVKSSLFFDECWKVTIALIHPTKKGVVVTDQDILAFCKGNNVHDYQADNKPFAARTVDVWSKEGGQCIIIAVSDIGDKDHVSYLAHEAFHAMEYIMEAKGVRHSPETSEAFAYLLESIFLRCYKLLNKR